MNTEGKEQADCLALSEFARSFWIDAQRRSAAVEVLWRMGSDDPTIRTFLEGWRHGCFPSFEEMVCQLAAQLATEKAEYFRVATGRVVAS